MSKKVPLARSLPGEPEGHNFKRSTGDVSAEMVDLKESAEFVRRYKIAGKLSSNDLVRSGGFDLTSIGDAGEVVWTPADKEKLKAEFGVDAERQHIANLSSQVANHLREDLWEAIRFVDSTSEPELFSEPVYTQVIKHLEVLGRVLSTIVQTADEEDKEMAMRHLQTVASFVESIEDRSRDLSFSDDAPHSSHRPGIATNDRDDQKRLRWASRMPISSHSQTKTPGF